MRFRFGTNRWKAIQAMVRAVFILGWGAVGTSVALHFHLENSWTGIALFAGPLIFLFSFLSAVFFKLSRSSVPKADVHHRRLWVESTRWPSPEPAG
jgi:hypothetical protein